MKTTKPKSQKKITKKEVKKQLEQSITDKFLEVIKSLGHDVSEISVEVGKASKRVAKKLTKKFTIVKAEVGQKIDDLVERTQKLAEMDLSFLYDITTDLLSIGFDVVESRSDPSCYDLLAS